jgi:glycine cleavage system H protein
MARTITYPQGYRYSKEHAWVHLQGDTATIGITFHAQHKLGDIVYVDLPKIGTRAEAGKSIGSVESVKAVSSVYAPISGEVIELNDSLASAPEKLNQDPHGAAWLIRLRVEKNNEWNSLLTAADYQGYVAALGDAATTSGQ